MASASQPTEPSAVDTGVSRKDPEYDPVAEMNDLSSEEPRRSAMKSIVVTATCTFAMILNIANATAVSIALPTIGRDLDIEESQLQWLTSAYSLSSGCMLLFLGRLADLYGRKLTFLLGVTVIGTLGLGCGFAQNKTAIFVLRGLQGIGGAAAIPASLGILAHRFPPSEARGRAFATFAAGAPIGAGLGTIIGGVLTEFTVKSWRSMFYLVFGLSILTMVCGLFTIDADVPSVQDRRVDWIGASLVTSGLVLIVFVLSDGSIAPRGWGTPYIIALLVVGVFLVALFIAWQAYLERIEGTPGAQSFWTPPPLMRLSVWGRAKGKLAVMLVIGFLEWCSFLSFAFWVQLYYQNFRHFSPIATMIRLLPMFVTGLLCNVIVALFVGRVDFVILVVTGTAMTALANLLFAVIRVDSTYWAFGFPAAIVSVFGADFVFAAGSIFVAKVSLPHEQSVSGALLQTMMQLGGAFGLAVTTIVFNSTLSRRSRHPDHGPHSGSPQLRAQEFAYKSAMWGGFAFGILGALLALVFLRGVGPVGHAKARPSPGAEGKALGDSDDEKTTQ